MQMKSVMMAALAFGCVHGALATNLSEPSVFMDEQYTGWRSGSDIHYYDNVGKWVHDLADASQYVANTGIVVNTLGHDLTLQKVIGTKTAQSPTNAFLTLNAKIAFTAYANGEEWDVANGQESAAISLKERTDGSLTFIVVTHLSQTWGHEKTMRWVEVSSGAVTPEENKFYEVKLEMDQSCRPPRTRYSVDGQVLADAEGKVWFSNMPRQGVAGLEPDRAITNAVSVVGVNGGGMLGKFTLSVQTQLTARAAVTIARQGSAAPGTPLSFTVAPHEGSSLVGAPTYQWYVTDAAGCRTAIAGATEATYTPTDAALGHWVEVEVSDEAGYAGAGRVWCSAIPVAYIDVDNGEWPDDGGYYGRERTNAVVRPSLDAHFYLTGDPSLEKYADRQYDSYASNDFEKITIHVRGNSTAYQHKKPYKLKLGTKIDPFGLGGGTKSKHWVLLANYNDDSQLRNKLFYDFSEKLGLVAMKSTWVDVVMNGEYIGVYQFCQQIRVAEERVNIFEWDTGKIAENTMDTMDYGAEDEDAIDSLLETNCMWMTTGKFTYNGTNFVLTAVKKEKGKTDKEGNIKIYWKAWNVVDISGGYIFEPDEKKISGIGYNPAASNFAQTNVAPNGVTMVIHMTLGTPEYGFTNPEVRQWVWDHWAYLSQTWMTGTGYGLDGRHFTETCDLETMTGYWLAHQIAGNGDSGLHSRYAYKDVGGKTFFGPAWDFDLIGRSVTTETLPDGSFVYKTMGRGSWSPGADVGNYAGFWSADPYFSYKLREKYWATREGLVEMVEDGGLIDQYKVRLATSAAANDLRWSMPIGFAGYGQDIGGVEHLRGYLKNCITWLDGQFATVGNTLASASKTAPEGVLRYVQDKSIVVTFPDAADVIDSPDVAKQTGVADVHQRLSTERPLAIQIAAPQVGAASVLVSVNGFSNTMATVTSGRANVNIPASAFKRLKSNFLLFTVKDADGATLGRNAACVTLDRGGTLFLVR